MSLTRQHIQESLHWAYIKAVAAKAGVMLSLPEYDYGWDGAFIGVGVRGERGNQRRATAISVIDFQLKSSVNCSVTDAFIKFDLEAKNYNDFAERSQQSHVNHSLLIVYCLPKDEENWLDISEEALLLRGCCYWTHISGTLTSNTRYKRIEIPRQQIFTPTALLDLLAKASQE